MRITVEVKDGSAVREPSMVNPIGRVLAVVDHGTHVTLAVDLDDDKLRVALDKPRRTF